MIDIDNLNKKFGIESHASFIKQEKGMIFLIISNKLANAEICLYGAHVTSFIPRNSKEVLWMSSESNFDVGKPIRGGIPVCFPWFGPHKTDQDKPPHGFARLVYWDVKEIAARTNDETLIRLQLSSSIETKAYWPYDFLAEVIVVVGKTLKITLKVMNKSDEQFNYSCALHSYFNISAIRNISIMGLEGTRYYNQFEPGDFIQDLPALSIQKAETRHYYDTEASCLIDDQLFKRKIHIAKAGSKITTVWNPGKETCANIADMPDDGYETFVCIETVNSFHDMIILNPGESHETSAIIGSEE